jgi:hypothetical protein
MFVFVFQAANVLLFDKIILILWVISEFNGYGQNYQIICKGEDRAIAP